MLAYYRGGFAALAEQIAAKVEGMGSQIKTSTAVKGLQVENGRVIGVQTANGQISADVVIATLPYPSSLTWLNPMFLAITSTNLEALNTLPISAWC